MPKTFLFNSSYLPEFQVVEQCVGNISYFPHSDQLPQLLRALNFEFYTGLPDKIARVDHRAKGYMKFQRYTAALVFCSLFNKARQDKLRLQVMLDRNLVARISIVQQIIEHQRLGPIHRFKFYAGDDLFTETYLNGRRIAFSEHLIDRFFERVPNQIGTNLTRLFDVFFGSPVVVMECNNSPAFVFGYGETGSVIAFPVRLSDTEYFLPTCLTVDVIHNLKPILPPIAYIHTYDPFYQMPEIRNWDPIGEQLNLEKNWRNQVPIKLEEPSEMERRSWAEIGNAINDICERQGQGDGLQFFFKDNIPGLGAMIALPQEPEPRYVTLDILKATNPDIDWEIVIPEHRLLNPSWYGST